jgi:hypothetical protein
LRQGFPRVLRLNNNDVCFAGKSVGLQIYWQILESQLFQYTVGFILVFNFLINVAEAELANIPDIDDNVFEALDTLDITLTVFYCVERRAFSKVPSIVPLQSKLYQSTDV